MANVLCFLWRTWAGVHVGVGAGHERGRDTDEAIQGRERSTHAWTETLAATRRGWLLEGFDGSEAAGRWWGW